MGSTRNVTGIVLRRRTFKHADRLYFIFTREEGKVMARAISVLKIKSKLAGQLEPFKISEIHLARSRTIDKIAGCVSLEGLPNITLDIKKSAAAAVVAETVDLLHQQGDPHDESWNLLVEMLRLLNEKSVNLLTIYAFSWKLLGLTGFQPQWNVCVQCKESQKSWAYIDPRHGGAVCSTCHKEVLPGVEQAIIALQYLDECDLPDAQQYNLDQETWNQVAFTIRKTFEIATDREWRSLNLLHRELQS